MGVYLLQSNHVSIVPLSPPDIEVVSIEVGTNHDFVLCSIYIPPDSLVCHISSSVLYLTGLAIWFPHLIGVFFVYRRF